MCVGKIYHIIGRHFSELSFFLIVLFQKFTKKVINMAEPQISDFSKT